MSPLKPPSFYALVSPVRGDAEFIRNVSEALRESFLWDDTPEGTAFWGAIATRLNEISKRAESWSEK